MPMYAFVIMLESFTSSNPGEYGRTTIEGKAELPTNEISIEDADPLLLSDISWPSHKAWLTFDRAGSYIFQELRNSKTFPVYTATYHFSNPINNKFESINLTDRFTSKQPCLFTGSRTGFFMLDPRRIKGDEFGNFIIGIQPFDLIKSIRKMFNLFHEIGHAIISDREFDIQLAKSAIELKAKHLPPVARAIEYAVNFANTIDESMRDAFRGKPITPLILANMSKYKKEINHSRKLFHERNAWAAAMQIVRTHHMPTGYQQNQSLRMHANLYLKIYGDSYHDSQFLNGIHRKRG